MKNKFYLTAFLMMIVFSLYSCESAIEKKQRIEQEEQQQIERERLKEIEINKKAIFNKYIDNSLSTGATPYAYCFGKNSSCTEWGCSQISIKTPVNSDVLVTIKRNNKVYQHAYIKAGRSFTFELPNGTYQAFFYYGKGWNPEKVIAQTDCGELLGGFIKNESFSKDFSQTLDNNILEYQLILQKNGNFSTKPSNSSEAF